MKHERNAQVSDLTGRLKELDHFTGALVRREPEPEAIPVSEAPLTRVPVPRRSRIFLRGGGGHGVFADLTLTAPVPRAATD
jgi:hypothetical protein